MLNFNGLEWILGRLKMQGFNIALRYHKNYINNDTISRLKSLKDRFNILIDDMSGYEILNRTRVLVSDTSSMSHTFSLTYFKKSIIFIPFDRYFFNDKYKVSWPDSFYQTECKTKEDLVKEISMLMKQKYALDIENYAKGSVYNLSSSKEFIAKFIDDELNNWSEND